MADDLRSRLDRVADRIDDASEPFERLTRARDRRGTRRRVGALFLALAITSAGTATVLAAFDDDGRGRLADDPPSPTEAWTPPEVLTLWPENPVRGDPPEQVQSAVDAGDAALAWRLDPRSVVERFGAEVLGWSEMTIIERDIETDLAPEVRVYDINPCPPDAICDMAVPNPALWLVQPVTQGDRGIWSVARVETSRLWITRPVLDEGSIPSGTSLRYELEFSDDLAVHVGVVASNGCDSIGELRTDVPPGTVILPVPDGTVAEGCGPIAAGYAFAYAQNETTVPVGDPLLEAAAIEWPYMTIVPVRIDLTQTPPLPELDCDLATGSVEVFMRELRLHACGEWPADTTIELRFQNLDPETPVALELVRASACEEGRCDGPRAWRAGVSVESRSEYRIPALEPGDYVLVDAVHPVTSFVDITVR